jgi:hypothetical protein
MLRLTLYHTYPWTHQDPRQLGLDIGEYSLGELHCRFVHGECDSPAQQLSKRNRHHR